MNNLTNFNKTDWGEVLVSGLSWTANVENGLTHVPNHVSIPVKGDGLVHRASGQHTIQIHSINLNANVVIEGTLDTNPQTATWIPVALTNTQFGNTSNVLNFVYKPPVPGVPYSGHTVELNQFFVASGQYAWLRANIRGMSCGIVDLIKIAF